MSSFNVSDSAIAVQQSMEKAIESVLMMLNAQDLTVDQEAYPLLSASQREFLRLKGITLKDETEELQSEVSDDSYVEDELNETIYSVAVWPEEERPDSVMTAIEPEEQKGENEEEEEEDLRCECVKEEERRLRAGHLGSPVKNSHYSECSDESDLESDGDEEKTESETGSESETEETESEENDSEEKSEESEDYEKEEKELEQEDTQTTEVEITQASTSEAPKTNTDRWVDELSNMKNLKTADQSSLLERMMAEMKKAWF